MSAHLQYIQDEKRQVCDTCGHSFKPKGFNSHQRACERHARESEEDAEQWASILHVQAAAVPALSVQAAHGNAWIEQDYNHDHNNDHYNADVDMSSDHSDSEPDVDVPGPTIDNIRTEFHPHVRIAPRIEVFTDFTQHHNYEPPCPEHQPWLPFSCRLDFEVAELAHEAALTHEQTTRLIRLVQRSKSEVFTLKNYADVRNTWEAASHRLTPFEKDTVVVLLDGTDKEYTVYFRPLWDWAIDILFIDEPWTADAFWDCQSQIPPDAKPLAFILYADKSKLSSFGREKGYPVIACLANLPVTIRNGSGMGGGRVVGWLPLVKEDPKYKGTPQFANFKVAVWHASIKKVLASIVPPSISGRWANCWDNIARLFYTLVLILSADYEEQSVMSLTWGVMSNFPCPICLISGDELASIMPHNYALQTSQATNTLLIEARAEHRKGRQEAILKSQSIRDVDNAFHDMNLKTTDVHHVLCYDRLHAVLWGLFGDHMWPELQLLIGLLGRNPTMKIDQNFDALPCWRNLNHFNAVMSISFTDGSKYKDIFKSYVLLNQLITFTAHDVLPNADETLEVQTTTTIVGGREALEKFSELMNKYIEKSQAIWPDKNWSFPKNHLAAHLFDDIEAKGVTRNYNTKPNEKCHGPLKESYQRWTNFKNVAPQILRADHWSLVSEFISGRVDELDAYNTWMAKDEDNENDPDTNQARVNMLPLDEITEFQFLKVNYESLVDFRQTTDYLRCSPGFHNLPRYDCVIVNTTAGVFFAWLLFLFTCVIHDTSYPIALVHPYDAPTGRHLQKDKHLKFWRVRSQPRETASEFILAESIIRGVALAPDPTTAGDFLVMDTVDSDIFLRMKQMHLAAGH
ncbi:uncharacterized protein EDB91DRAFT_1080570 [Suillus paluster]|uniref:uncharacterized protein n=1 Tax=Suillus paluster TaxID=48578 RepID=UPI001B88007A|nr:uncharacterized protein EDB91DRAFT_1080570 [Suillus paluster]KAG1745062.1 hypothetical protein EDB91DRAFT_1080570 [Suillus paluster]